MADTLSYQYQHWEGKESTETSLLIRETFSVLLFPSSQLLSVMFAGRLLWLFCFQIDVIFQSNL